MSEPARRRPAPTASAQGRIQSAFAQAPVAIVVTEGPEHRLTVVNAQAAALFGRTDLVGRRYADAYPELADSLVAALDRVHATGEPYVAREARVVRARAEGDPAGDGAHDEVYLDLVLQPLREAESGGEEAASGPVTGILHFAVDVTAQVRAREAVATSEAKYRALFQTMRQGFCVVEMLFDDAGRPVDYRFVETNPAFERQTGLVGAVGRTARELVPGLEGHWFGTYGRVALTGEPTRFEEGSAAMGRWFDVEAFRVGAPEARRVAILFTDVSAARAAAQERERLLADSERARAEAEEARRAAEAANQAKSEFLAVMSHELRTPLNAIGGYAELLELGIRGPVTAEQRADLARIQKSQRHLLGLINGVLNYARVEAGAVHYEVSEVPLDEVLATCEALIAPQVKAKRLTLTHEGCDAALRVRADRDKVQQVVLNLLSNAMKFTEPGGRLRLACVAGADEVQVRVHDTGIGIAADQLTRVFEPFVQVDATLTRTREGTGLGLAISRDLARGMGGDLTVESTAGVGSTFTLTLPRP